MEHSLGITAETQEWKSQYMLHEGTRYRLLMHARFCNLDHSWTSSLCCDNVNTVYMHQIKPSCKHLQ